MTILPTKRTTTTTEENQENIQQNVNSDRTNRRRDDIVLNETNTPARRVQFQFGKNSNERKDRLRKRYKETDRNRDREREREQKREVRREQKRDRVAKRDSTEPLLDNNANLSVDDSQVVETNSNNNETNVANKEDCTGFNSEDEYDDEGVIKKRHLPDEEWQKRDDYFSRAISNLGYEIKKMTEDGACLFRSIADQVYGDQEFHYQVREDCMNYIVQNRDYFEPYVTEDFDKYVTRKRTWNVHGNHLEIQAMSELYNRTIEVYCYQSKPIHIFNCSRLINSYEPIRLSYHRMCHYNSIFNPNKPSVGVGLGLPNYHTTDINRRTINEAIRASDELLIEQTMLEDKLKATDWEATNEAIEEQVARESYIQYFRDSERRLKNQGHHPLASSSSSTITSAMISSPRSSRRCGSVSPKGSQSPKGSTSPKTTFSPLASPRNSFGAIPSNNNNNNLTSFDDTNLENEQVCIENDDEQVFNKHTNNNTPRLSIDQQKSDLTTLHKDFTNFSEAGPSNLNNNNYVWEDFDQEIMAQVLAESQKTYFNELKHKKTKKRIESPGPSTSS